SIVQDHFKDFISTINADDRFVPFVFSSSGVVQDLAAAHSIDLADFQLIADAITRMRGPQNSPALPRKLPAGKTLCHTANFYYFLQKSLELVDSRCIDPAYSFPDKWKTAYIWHEAVDRIVGVKITVDRRVRMEETVIRKFEATTGAPTLPDGTKNEMKKSF